MPNIRYKASENPTGQRGAVFLSSSSSGPTTVFTCGTSLKGPDGQTGYGAIFDRIQVFCSSSAAASRAFRLFLASSSGPTLDGPKYEFWRDVLAPGQMLTYDGPIRGKDAYLLQGWIDALAPADVCVSCDESEIY